MRPDLPVLDHFEEGPVYLLDTKRMAYCNTRKNPGAICRPSGGRVLQK